MRRRKAPHAVEITAALLFVEIGTHKDPASGTIASPEPDADAVEPDESFSGSNADIKDGNARSLRTLDNISQHHKHSQCPKDVEKLITTLVLQTTLDRLPLIKETCHRWKSPIITVVYLTEDESNNIWEQTVEDYSSHCGEHLHMIPYIAANEDERKFAYPINKMRNMVRISSTTSTYNIY